MKVINGISMFLFVRLMGSCLSEKVKRMVVLASLAGYVRATAELDDETAKELNEFFSLCFTKEAALKLPVLLNESIWKDVAIRKEFAIIAMLEGKSDSRVREFVIRIKQAIPQWLTYNERQLEVDITSLCRSYKLLA